MLRSEKIGAQADQVKRHADDLGSSCGVVGYPPFVLRVARVAKHDRGSDARLYQRRKSADRAMHDGSALAELGNVPLVHAILLGRLSSGKQTNLYPPAMTTVDGHFVAARVKSRVASSMAESVVPFGLRLSKTAALYAPPTPWQATLPEPNKPFKALHMAGPTVAPWFLRSACADFVRVPIEI